jgi:hypothetical protein
MGRGENPYKMRWADGEEPLRRVLVYNRTPNGRLERLREEVVKPALRRARDVFWKTKKKTAPRVLKERVIKAASERATRGRNNSRGP